MVILDIQMPEMDGFAVIEAVGAQAMPVVIFVTAYDQYAVNAFKVHALDYILKPFDWERFRDALLSEIANQTRERLERQARCVAATDEKKT